MYYADTGRTRSGPMQPLEKFGIRVCVDGRLVAVADELTGLEPGRASVDYREIDHPDVRKIAGVIKVDSVTLKRGIISDPDFQAWIANAGAPGADKLTPSQGLESRRDLTIEIVNEAGDSVGALRLKRVWVSEIKALPALDTDTGGPAFEIMRLEHEGWELVSQN